MKATVTSSTNSVNVKTVSDDVLIHPRTTSVHVSVPNAGSGGGTYVEKDFQTVTLPLALSAGTHELSINGGKQFLLLGYTCSVGDIRIRGYVDSEHRDLDYGRPVNQDPLMLGGVLFELVTQPGTYRFSLPVTCWGNPMPLLVDVNSPVNTTIDFLIY